MVSLLPMLRDGTSSGSTPWSVFRLLAIWERHLTCYYRPLRRHSLLLPLVLRVDRVWIGSRNSSVLAAEAAMVIISIWYGLVFSSWCIILTITMLQHWYGPSFSAFQSHIVNAHNRFPVSLCWLSLQGA